MIIKCPQCATGYNIPDEILGDKPRKMRCTKCRNMFTVARHSEHPPDGYMEFTGKQHLPAEFAFLRKSVMPPPPAEEVEVEIDVDSKPPAAEPPAPQRQPAAPPPPAAPPQQNPQPPASMFGGSVPAWETEAPYELGEYALRHTGSHINEGHQKLGKILFGIFVVLTALLIFVAWRNSWAFSPLDLPEQMAFAFSGKPRETFPDSVNNMEVTILNKATVVGIGQTPYLCVTGEIYNNNPTARGNVLLRGRLVDSQGDVRSETRLPCGRSIDEITLKATPKGGVRSLFLVDGQNYDCHLSPDGSTLFQIIFENVPVDYDNSFQIDVRPVAAIVK